MKDGAEPIAAQRVDGLVVGQLVDRDIGGRPMVRFTLDGATQTRFARACIPLGPDDTGRDVVLAFEDGCSDRPILLGCLVPSEDPARIAATADGERLELTAEREIVLRCGKASVTLTRTGRIILRGTDILSRSSGPNRIRGGSIQLN